MWQTNILQLHLLVSQRKPPVFVQVCLFVFMYNWGNFNHSLTETDTHSNWCLNKHEVWIINEQGNSINLPFSWWILSFSSMLPHSNTHTASSSQIYLVLVSCEAPGPHLLDHQVPKLSFRFQISFKSFLPSPDTKLQAWDSQEHEGSWGDLYFLKQKTKVHKDNIYYRLPFQVLSYWAELYLYLGISLLLISHLNLGTVPPPHILAVHPWAGRAVAESWQFSPLRGSSLLKTTPWRRTRWPQCAPKQMLADKPSDQTNTKTCIKCQFVQLQCKLLKLVSATEKTKESFVIHKSKISGF